MRCLYRRNDWGVCVTTISQMLCAETSITVEGSRKSYQITNLLLKYNFTSLSNCQISHGRSAGDTPEHNHFENLADIHPSFLLVNGWLEMKALAWYTISKIHSSLHLTTLYEDIILHDVITQPCPWYLFLAHSCSCNAYPMFRRHLPP